MGSLSIWHWLVVLAIVLVLFGGSSKISTLMGDFAKGIKSFKKNMGEDESMEHGTHLSPPTPQVSQVPPVGSYVPQPQAAAASYPPAGQPYPTAAAPVEPVRHPG